MKSRVFAFLIIAASITTSVASAQTADGTDQIPQAQAGIVANDPLPAVALNLSTVALPAPAHTKASRATVPTVAMYAAYGMLQALDAHSTLQALDGRGAEGNPFVQPFASSPARLISFKVASTAGVLYLAERLRKKNKVAALALLIGANSMQTFVVVHNYRLAKR
jgi:uncharacterized protein DUF5658